MSRADDIYTVPSIPRQWGYPVAALPPARLVRRNVKRRLVLWVMVPTGVLLLLWTPVLSDRSHQQRGVALRGVVALGLLTGVIAWQVVVMRRAMERKRPPVLIARAGYIEAAEGSHPGWALALDNLGGQNAHYDLDEIEWWITQGDSTRHTIGIDGLRMHPGTKRWPCMGDYSDSAAFILAGGTDELLYLPIEDAQRVERLLVSVEFTDDKGDCYAQDFLLSPAEAVARQPVPA